MIRPATALGLLALAACAPPPWSLSLLTSERVPDRHGLFRIDWRGQVRSDELEEPPLQVAMLRWAPQETSAPTAIPSEQEVVVGSSAGTVVAFSMEGTFLWRTALQGPVTSAVTYADGRLYAVAGGGGVYALDPGTGQVVWTHDIAEEPAASPVLADGAVYVATHQASLFALDAASGKRRWHYRRERERTFTLRTVAAPRVAGDRVIAGFSDGEIVALSSKDGSVAWQQGSGPGDQFVDADATPQVLGGQVYVASFTGGLSALAARDGQSVWHVPFRGVTGLLLANGILFATAVGKVAAFAPESGSLLWEKGLSDRSPGALRAAGSLLLVPTTHELIFLDQRSGTQLGHGFNPGRGVDAAPAVSGREVYVLSNAGWLYALGVR